MNHTATASRTAGMLMLALLFVAPARGQVWQEDADGGGDAGETLATAQQMIGIFDEIRGKVGTSGDVDMYQIFIDDPSTWFATTEVNPGGLQETWLYLFRADGTCEYSNHEAPGGSAYSLLPAGHEAGPQEPGNYYLAIGRYELKALDAGGSAVCEDPRDFGPVWDRINDGVGGTVASWESGTLTTGTYRITMGSTSLPVEMARFDAVVNARRVLLQWETLSETGAAGFEVQARLAGAKTFERIGYVGASGSDVDGSNYGFASDDLPVGRHAFRLKQMDADGSYAYSPVVLADVALEGVFEVSDVYPNPVRTDGRIDVAASEGQPVVVALYDILGRRVARLYDGFVAADDALTVPVARDLPTGLYVVRVTGETFRTTRTFSVVR